MTQTRLFLVGAASALLMLLGPGCGDDDRRVVDSGPGDASTGDGGEMDAGTDAGGGMDAGTDAGTDAGMDDAGTDAGFDGGNPGAEDIAAVRETADGTGLSLRVEDVFVTYVKPAVGDDPAGFFVQATTMGPALFVAVDPSTLGDVPEAGDEVGFTVTDIETVSGQQRVTGITDWGVVTTGNDISGLIQDLTSATDVVSALDSYESEYITVDATIAAAFGGAGTDHVAALIDTDGITGDADLRFRLPTTLRDSLELVEGCEITVTAPLWRFFDAAQVSAWDATDIIVVSCPAPQVVSAVATAQTEVVVTFDRLIDSTSLMASGSQFTFTDGLSATAASLTDVREVTVTTETQDPDTLYTVTVASTLTDTVGTGIDASANTADFMGFPIPLGVGSVDFPVIAHGGQLVLTGSSYTGATSVTVGGVSQTFTVDSDTQITIAALDDTTPTGAQDIVVSNSSDSGPAFSVTVIRLVISEVDADTMSTDDAEFIEVDAGMAAVDLSGYSVVLFNGSDDASYDAIELATTTDSNGRILIGPTGFTPTPDVTFSGADNQVQNGADAVTIYQGTPSDFPTDTTISATGLIDALVYDTNDTDDDGLMTMLLGAADPANQINEDANGAKDTESIQRCGTARLDASVWQVATATPGSDNTCL